MTSINFTHSMTISNQIVEPFDVAIAYGGCVYEWIRLLLEDYKKDAGIAGLTQLKPPLSLTKAVSLQQRMLSLINHFLRMYEDVVKEVGNSGKQLPSLITEVSRLSLLS
jgi:hypothetical protein